MCLCVFSLVCWFACSCVFVCSFCVLVGRLFVCVGEGFIVRVFARERVCVFVCMSV